MTSKRTSRGARQSRPLSPRTEVPTYTYCVVNHWNHDPEAYTEGLSFHEGYLYESTGGYGSSSVRRIPLRRGKVLKKSLANELYAEGLTVFKGKVFQLTWTSNQGFIYNLKKLELIGSFPYVGKRWGLTHDDQFLIVSDGSDELRFVDPRDFEVKKSVFAKDDGGRPLRNLNELEYVRGEIYANIHTTNRVARIDAESGRLLAWVDLEGLGPIDGEEPNGIAYDDARNRLFVTGKYWPKLFQISLVPPNDNQALGFTK